MTQQPIDQQRVVQLFAEKLQIEVASNDADLIDEGLLDSLVFVDLITHLEVEFQIEISIAELEIDNFRSINQIAAFMGRQSATAAEGSPPQADANGASNLAIAANPIV